MIKGDKYKAANAKMYKEAKKAYAYQAELDELKADDIRDGYFMGADYKIILTPKVKYKSSKKVSVLTEVYEYSGGVHGNIGYISYNTYKGKIVSLKKAFKSNTAYLNGKNMRSIRCYIIRRIIHLPIINQRLRVMNFTTHQQVA